MLRTHRSGRLLLLLASLSLAVAEAQQPSASGGAGAPGFTLQVNTNLVILDVTVHGADGKPVHGLKASDFVVREDGKPQSIRSLNEYSAPEQRAGAAVMPRLQPGFFSNFTPVPAGGPANVLLLDTLNTPLRDQQYVRQQILDYLKHAPAGAPIAIFGLANTLSILQGFTSDPHLLAEALARKNGQHVSSLLDDPVGGGAGTEPTPQPDPSSSPTNDPDILGMIANAQQFEAERQAFQQQERAQITLDALNSIGRYLANVTGRKNLIWFSASFPVSILGDPDINNGFTTQRGTQQEFRETMALLTRSQISLYPVDARGLTAPSVYDAGSSRTNYARDPKAGVKDLNRYNARVTGENSTMLEAAKETGGQAYVNTNGLAAAVSEAISDGSNYYTLTYSPTNRRQDGAYRRTELTVPGKQVVLSYRRGYFEDDAKTDAGASKTTVAAAEGANADKSVITRTMVRGAPTPTQILFNVRAVPATGAPETAPVDGNQVVASNPEAKPPYIRYAVDMAVDQRGLSFVEDRGRFRGDFQFVAFLYDVDGNVINRAGSVVHVSLTPDQHRAFLQKALVYSQDVSVPRVSHLFLRLAVYDLNDEHVGAIEIPLDAIKNLPPLSAPATAPRAK